VKPKTKNVGLFWCFEPISKQSKQTELFRNKPKQTETMLNFHKIPKYALYQTVSAGLLNRNIETLCFGIEAKQPKQTISKQTKTNSKNQKTPKFPEKIPKYTSYQTVSVGLLFVSVQSKHRKSLFRYRSETTKTNVLFRIVSKLVSVVSNRN
jgi:hypothetical protein